MLFIARVVGVLTQLTLSVTCLFCSCSPGDVSAMTPGGIRMGTPALTSR
jgi:glycine/serine hydroxymethyltransferase